MGSIFRNLLRSSGKRWFDETEQAGMPFMERMHGYVYSRWPYFYISGGLGRNRALTFFMIPLILLMNWYRPFKPRKGFDGKNFADSYHGKVLPLDEAVKLITVNREVVVEDLEKVIPYKTAREIVLKNPESIALLDCPCRVARENPCLPLDVCLIVGEPFASFMLEHHPKRSRRISPEEAVEVLRAEDERGHVHHAFFKEAMMGRFYAICNCCACCCGAMQAQRNGVEMLCSSGYVCEVDQESCVGCGVCADYCQFQALSVTGSVAALNLEQCMGCGVCVSKCPKGALSLRRETSRGEPLEIEFIMRQAAEV